MQDSFFDSRFVKRSCFWNQIIMDFFEKVTRELCESDHNNCHPEIPTSFILLTGHYSTYRSRTSNLQIRHVRPKYPPQVHQKQKAVRNPGCLQSADEYESSPSFCFQIDNKLMPNTHLLFSGIFTITNDFHLRSFFKIFITQSS